MPYKIECTTLNAERTLFCGQCFRWERTDGGFLGFSGDKSVFVRQLPNGIELDCDKTELPYWRGYFDADFDYNGVIESFSADKTLREACNAASGIHILRQEPFETLISFIISQNNNIPRITGIISRLCESFGEKTARGYAFPTVQTLAALTPEELAPIRAGFRARYIVDAATRVKSGEINFSRIDAGSCDDGARELMKIIGVGQKVADCVLLFAFHKTEAFPKDVWIKRALAEYYPDGLPECIGNYGGIAQQFLFEYIRKKQEEA